MPGPRSRTRELLLTAAAVLLGVAALVGLVVLRSYTDRDDAPTWSLLLTYGIAGAGATYGTWRLVTTWDHPTRPPIDWRSRDPYEALLVPGLVVFGGVMGTISGGWGLLFGPLVVLAGLGVYAIELRWYRKPVALRPASSATERMDRGADEVTS